MSLQSAAHSLHAPSQSASVVSGGRAGVSSSPLPAVRGGRHTSAGQAPSPGLHALTSPSRWGQAAPLPVAGWVTVCAPLERAGDVAAVRSALAPRALAVGVGRL